MMRKTLILTVISLCLVWWTGKPPNGFLAQSFVAKAAVNFINLNGFQIDVDEGLSAEIKVVLEVDGMDSFIIFSNSSPATQSIPYRYGSHVFKVFVDGEKIGSHEFFKENYWHSNHFYLYIEKNDNTVVSRLRIEGPN